MKILSVIPWHLREQIDISPSQIFRIRLALRSAAFIFTGAIAGESVGHGCPALQGIAFGHCVTRTNRGFS